jgi:chemotaxis methyl-accepting protein methylase
MRAGDDLSAVLHKLRIVAAELTGFSPDAIVTDALRRALRTHLTSWTPDDIDRAAARRDEALIRVLQQAVSVGETYFFRHPEQFEHLVDVALPALARDRDGVNRAWRVWSAGCATGEEAYTLAACFAAARGRHLPGDAQIHVLGSDLLERNIRTAQGGVYGRWSVRGSGPELFPLWTQEGTNRVRVQDHVRPLVTFSQHNLLEPSPFEGGQADVIFCRNVLVYFSPEAAQNVVSHLVNALAPGGIIAFGPMDLQTMPPGLVRAGPAELQLYRRVHHRESVPAAPATGRALPSKPPRVAKPIRPRRESPVAAPAPAPKPGIEPVAVHLKVLGLVDAGEDADALRLLEKLCAAAPDYVAGLTEHALILSRNGDIGRAAQRMREVLRLTSTLPDEAVLPGPEPLPAAFYVSSAEAFLERMEGSSR